MKVLLFTLLLAAGIRPGSTGAQQRPEPQPQPQPHPRLPEKADRSAIDVKPGGQVIKEQGPLGEDRLFSPLRPHAQVHCSPIRNISGWRPSIPRKKDIKYWVIFGAATGTLIATDKWTVKQLPNSSSQVRLGNYTSNIGAAYSLVPLSAGFYFLGTAAKSERFRETGLLGFETLIDTTIVDTIIKAATHRARPLEGDGKGHFWDSQGSVLNASFPSGHAINTFALASVFAHQYHNWPVRIHGIRAGHHRGRRPRFRPPSLSRAMSWPARPWAGSSATTSTANATTTNSTSPASRKESWTTSTSAFPSGSRYCLETGAPAVFSSFDWMTIPTWSARVFANEGGRLPL